MALAARDRTRATRHEDKVLVPWHSARVRTPSRPFLWGWGHMLALHGELLVYSCSPVTDEEALSAYWERVGGYIRIAMNRWDADRTTGGVEVWEDA